MPHVPVEVITQIIFFAATGVFIFLEWKFPYVKGRKFFREGFWLDFVGYSVIQSFFLGLFIWSFVIRPLDDHFHWSRLHLVTAWPLALQVLFFLVTHDFYIYWFHRLQHNNKWLWRTHEAHHSVKEVDWLAGSRSHFLEIIINQSIEFAPIILLGAAPVVVPIKMMLDAVWGMYIHSNINVKAGKIQYVINGPQMHQWHHADDRRVFYCNYGTKFAFWDWIFGTAFLPDFKPEKFGLPYEYPRDYVLQTLYAFYRFDYTKVYENKALYLVLNSRFIAANKTLDILKANNIKRFTLPSASVSDVYPMYDDPVNDYKKPVTQPQPELV